MYPYRYAPGVEIRGQVVRALITHVRHDQVVDSLKAHDLNEIDPEKWYPAERLIDLFADWYKNKSGVMLNMVSVGIAVMENAPLPPEADDYPLLEQLSLVKATNDRSYRHVDGGSTDSAGRFELEQLGDMHIKYTVNSIWPDDLIYGYIYGLARRFLGDKYSFVVKYDEDIPRQADGGDHTIMHLTWEPS